MMSLYRESGLFHRGLLAPEVGICCPNLLGSDQGHRIQSEWRAKSLLWSPHHGVYDRTPVHQARRDLGGAEPCDVA
jgi:hypothetical protein